MGERLKNTLQRARPHILPALLLVMAVFAVYGRGLNYDFLRNWDDNHYVLENLDIQGFDWQRLTAVFTRYYVGNYAPLQMLSYMLDYLLWGLFPGGYHLTNIVLHCLNGLLLYRLLFRLVPGRLAAWSGAALFLLHPVQVETVLWISQRKNLLAMFFFLLAWEFYLLYRDSAVGRSGLYYAGSLVALMMALLSKSVAVIFPLVMLVFDLCYPDGQGRSKFRDKIPYIVVSLMAAAMALYSQTPDPLDGGRGGRSGYHGNSPWVTFLTMMPVLCSYFRLIFWPSGLSALYDPPLHVSPDAVVLAAILLLCAIFCLIFQLYRHERPIAFWLLYFFIALLPVSQIVPLVTLMNDRYLYFPLICFSALLTYLVSRSAASGVRSSCIMPAVVTLLILLSAVSISRIDVWRDGVTLWRDTVEKSPRLPLAWEALGEAYHYNKRPDRVEAEKAYLQAIKLSPENNLSRYNLGVLYLDRNDLDSAEKVIRELLQKSPQHVMGLTLSGDLALRRYNYAEAERSYRKALSLQPEAVPINQKIGNLMIVTGRLDEARKAYLQADKLQWGTDPFNAYELARLEAIAGDTGASLKWLETALQRGYNNFDGILSDEELTPVLADGRFADLATRYFPKR